MQLEYAALDAVVLIHIFRQLPGQGQDKAEWKSFIVSDRYPFSSRQTGSQPARYLSFIAKLYFSDIVFMFLVVSLFMPGHNITSVNIYHALEYTLLLYAYVLNDFYRFKLPSRCPTRKTPRNPRKYVPKVEETVIETNKH